MIPIPTSFPSTNSHRIAHFLPEQPRDDFPRLEDLTADGLRTARNAHHMLKACAFPKDRQWTADLAELTTAIEKRRLLNDRFVDAATSLIERMSQEDFREGQHVDVDQIEDDLREAVNLSNRVRDLLAAERDVGWHRGIRD